MAAEGQAVQQLLEQLISGGEHKLEEDKVKRQQQMSPLKHEVSKEAVKGGKEFAGQVYDGAKDIASERAEKEGQNLFADKSGKVTKDDVIQSFKNMTSKNKNPQEVVNEKREPSFAKELEKNQLDEIKKTMNTMSPKQQDSFLQHLAQTNKFKQDPEKFAKVLDLNKRQTDLVKGIASGKKDVQRGLGLILEKRRNEKLLDKTVKKAVSKTLAQSLHGKHKLAKVALRSSVPVVGKVLLAKDLSKHIKENNAFVKGANKSKDIGPKDKVSFKNISDQSQTKDSQSKVTDKSLSAVNKTLGEPVKDVKSLINEGADMVKKSAGLNISISISDQVKDAAKEQVNEGRDR